MADQPARTEPEAGPSAQPRYRAFLSYSHVDATAAGRLHRRLETYRYPSRLIGQPTPRGAVPARQAPIFRDREELPARDDLGEAVREALATSAALIVVASPAAAASRWVDREIRTFREDCGGCPVFVALVDGEPGEALPPALTEGGHEPLCADLRPHRDGRRIGALKLLAGLAGLPLDDLVRREDQRRRRRVTAITLGSLAAVLVMLVLTVLAVRARAEAERQQAAAERLVEFMLTDLRDQLEGVGRLDALTDANKAALAYYAGQELKGLSAESLGKRARLLHAMGEDDQARGDLAAAEAQFSEAHRTTAALLADAPSDPERLFTHAQSEFWLGSLADQQGRYDVAERRFVNYAQLADRLIAASPDDPRSHQEAAYAAGNLCTAAQRAQRLDELVELCRAALARSAAVVRRLPGDFEARRSLANRHAWLADAYRDTGELDAARGQRRAEAAVLAELSRADPKNVKLRLARIFSDRALAKLDALAGDIVSARVRIAAAIAALERIVAAEPSNRRNAADLAEMRLELRGFEMKEIAT